MLAIQISPANYELTLDITKGNTLVCWQEYHRFILYFTILSFAKNTQIKLKLFLHNVSMNTTQHDLSLFSLVLERFK